MRNINSLITVLALSFATLSVSACATSGDEQMDDEYSDAESNASAPGKVDMWQSTDGQWRFHVVSGNGRNLLTSEGYTSRTGAINGILSVLDNGVDPAMYSVNKTATGYNLRLRAANFETIAFTQVYSTKSSATRAITSSVKAVTSYLDKREANTAGARVDVEAGETGKFHFNFFAKNGEKVLSSESYDTDAAAFNGAFAVQAEGTKDTACTIKENTAGGFYFTVQALNGQIVGVSQQYTTRTGAADGVASLKALLPAITVL
jgi:uncharacterized protein